MNPALSQEFHLFCKQEQLQKHATLDKNLYYKGSERGGLSAPPSSVVGNALVVIDDGIESVNVKNRYQGARVSARRANREPEDGIRWKFVHGRVVVVR